MTSLRAGISTIANPAEKPHKHLLTQTETRNDAVSTDKKA